MNAITLTVLRIVVLLFIVSVIIASGLDAVESTLLYIAIVAHAWLAQSFGRLEGKEMATENKSKKQFEIG